MHAPLLSSLLFGTMALAPAAPAPFLARPQTAASKPDPADTWTFRNARIEGMGFVTGLVVQDQSPFHAYAKTDVGGVYRLDRLNDRWLPMMDGFALEDRVAFDVEAFGLIPSRRNGLVILAPREHPTDQNPFGGREEYGEVYRTLDNGKSWQPLGLMDSKVRVAGNGAYRGFAGERIAVDPASPERMLVTTRIHGTWRREIDGSWTPVSGLPPVTPWTNPDDPTDLSFGWNTPGHSFVLFDPQSGVLPNGSTRTVFVGDHESGVYRSDDGGMSFSPMAASPAYAARASLAKDGFLYVNTTRLAEGPHVDLPELGGIFRWDPSSDLWTEITPPLASNPAQRDRKPYSGVAIHPTLPQVIAAADTFSSDKFVSMDRGLSWTRSNSQPLANQPPYTPPATPENFQTAAGDWGNVALVFDPRYPNAAWGINGFGVIHTSDATAAQAQWGWEMANLEELVMHSVIVPPVPFHQGGADCLSACMDMVGFRHASVDALPLDRIGKPLAIGQASGIAYSAQNPSHSVFVGWDQWMPWVPLSGASSDNGQSWTPFADTSPGVGGRIVMSATNPDHLVWEPSQWRPLKVSFDGGSSWQGAVDLDATFDPGDPAWDQVGWAFHVSNGWWQGAHLAADRVNGDRFYRYTYGQWMSSQDGGLNWSHGFNSWALGGAAPPIWTINTRLVPHPTREGEVWIAASANIGDDPSPLFRTTDAGATVGPVPGIESAMQVAFGKGKTPSTPAIYVLGTLTGSSRFGLYLSEDDGQTWRLLNRSPHQALQRACAMDADMRVRGRVYIATSGRGLISGRAVAAEAGPEPR